MALYQTVDLDQDVDGSGSPPIECRWVAVHNPVYLEFQRKDYETTTAYASGGFLRLQFSAPTGAQVGDRLYVNCPGAYVGLANVTGFSTNDIITDVAIALAPGTYPGYANNLTQRVNYFIELVIQNQSGTIDYATIQATPDTTGLVGVDISPALQSFTSNADGVGVQLSDDRAADGNALIKFRYKVRELWRPASGLVTQPFGTASANSYGVNGAFPIGHQKNGNYADYYPNTTDPKAFITDFVRPKYFEGWPFDVAFVFPTDYALMITSLVTAQYNAAGVQVGGSGTQVDAMLSGNIVRAVPDLDFSGASSQVTEMLIQLQLDPGSQPLLTDLYVDVVPADLICDGVFLIWLGEKGNRSHWLFNLKYTETMQVDGGDTYQTAFDGVIDLRERANWYNKRAYKKLTIGAGGLTRNDIEGLKTLLKSTKVDTYDAATGLFTGVLVEPGTFTIGKGDDTLFNIELSIVFPEQFNQTA